MGRIRPLFPEFWRDERLLRESKDVGRAYAWLWGEADDIGRVPLDAWQIKRGCFSVYPDSVDDCAGYIARLLAIDRLWPYDVDGQRYAVIRTACKRWRPNPKDARPGGTWRPAPPEAVLSEVEGYAAEAGRILRGCVESARSGMVPILWPYQGAPPDVPWWTPSGQDQSQGRPEDIPGTSTEHPGAFPPQVAGSRYQVAGDPPQSPPEGAGDVPAEKKPVKGWVPSAALAAARPAFVALEVWDGFIAMRRTKNWPLTERALVLLTNDLARWHAAGHDVNPLLDEASLKTYRAPVDPDKRFSSGNGTAKRPAQRDDTDDLLRRAEERDPGSVARATAAVFGGGR